jgi:hypothetical protein
VKLLEEVAALVSDDDVATRPAFVGWMSLYLKNALLALLDSRRAAVVLAALAVLNCLALRLSAANRAAVTTICSWFLTPLLRSAANPSSSTAVSAAAAKLLNSLANACLLTLEGLNVVFTACGAMSAPVRRCAMGVLQAYLQAVRGTAYQISASAYTDALHRVVRDGVADADAEVRANARRCFWALYLLEPASTTALLRGLPPNVRRQLATERVSTLERLETVAAAPPDSTVTAAMQAAEDVEEPPTNDIGTSRTVTLKDELQAAAARRARACSSRSASPSTRPQQLLLMAKDTPYDPDKRPVVVHPAAASFKRSTAPRQAPLFQSMESTDWSVRRAALLQASRLCESGALADDLSSLLPVVLLRLQDNHFRVVEAAHECLRCCLGSRPSATQVIFRRSICELLRALFHNTLHTKPTVCNGAYVLLDTLLRQHESPATLLESVLRISDSACGGYAVEERVAEFFLYGVLGFPTLFAQQSITSTTVRCVVAHLCAAETDPSAKANRTSMRAAVAAWTRVLAGVALACPDVFGDAVERLPQPGQDAVCSALREYFGLSGDGQDGVDWCAAEKAACDTAVSCVFAERVKEAHATERARLLAHGRDGRLSRTKVSGSAISLPSRLDRPMTFPPVLKKLLLRSAIKHTSADGAVLSLGEGGGPQTPPHHDHRADAVGRVVLSSSASALPADAAAVAIDKAASAVHSTQSSLRGAAAEAAVSTGGWDEEDVGAVASRDENFCSNNAPAAFLRCWPSCRDAAGKRAALLRVACGLRRYAASQRNTGDGAAVPPSCATEELERLLMCWEREVVGPEYANDHLLRWAVFYALEALLLWSAARSAVARQLSRIVNMCRNGMDDAFLEVQLQAVACLEAALLSCKLPLDMCFGVVITCLIKWIEGPLCDAATPGWLELLHMLRRLFEQGQGMRLKAPNTTATASDHVNGRQSTAGEPTLALTSSVMRRIADVMRRCLGHCNPLVRLSAVLVLVSMQQAMGEATAAPFLTSLTPAQRRVLRVYHAKVTSPLSE